MIDNRPSCHFDGAQLMIVGRISSNDIIIFIFFAVVGDHHRAEIVKGEGGSSRDN